jgi:hypothetical protein
MQVKYFLFVYTEHPSHRDGGCSDCLGVFSSTDDALDAGNAHLNNLWATPNEANTGYIDILISDVGAFTHYKRYRHEPHPFYDRTDILSDYSDNKKDTQHDCHARSNPRNPRAPREVAAE